VSFFATTDELAQKVSVAVTNQLQDQPISGQPTIPTGRGWTISPPVRSFLGRVDQLSALWEQLTAHGAAALYGMGGVGKTQLALAYAQRYRGDYTLGWWVPAETEEGLVTALAELGIALGLPAGSRRPSWPPEPAMRSGSGPGGCSSSITPPTQPRLPNTCPGWEADTCW
jgi:hypothetical protein